MPIANTVSKPVPPDAVRIWRGFRNSTLTEEKFFADLGSVFVPATVELQWPNGLDAYIPSFPAGKGKPATVPDETAILFWDSQLTYHNGFNTLAIHAGAQPDPLASTRRPEGEGDSRRALRTLRVGARQTAPVSDPAQPNEPYRRLSPSPAGLSIPEPRPGCPRPSPHCRAGMGAGFARGERRVPGQWRWGSAAKRRVRPRRRGDPAQFAGAPTRSGRSAPPALPLALGPTPTVNAKPTSDRLTRK